MSRHFFLRPLHGDGTKLLIAGDFCPREENCPYVSGNSAAIVQEIRPFFQAADLKMLQWECAVTNRNTPILKSGPCHRCTPETVEFALQLEIDICLLANNHTGDYGPDGIRDTLHFLQAGKLKTVGAGENLQQAAEPLLIEKNGTLFSILNFAEHEFGIATVTMPGAAPLDPLQNIRRISEEKKAGRVVIVVMHGGHEHYPFPTLRMRNLCRAFAEAGAAIVLNCHPHCPLGYEVHKGTPILYSPGNFYFPRRPTSLPIWEIGYLANFQCDSRGACSFELTAYRHSREHITPLAGEEERKFFHYLQLLTRPIQDDAELTKLFDAWSSQLLYLDDLNSTLPMNFHDPSCLRAWMGKRNLFWCESHVDLLRNTLALIETGYLDAARQYLPEIQKLQKGPLSCQI